MAAAAAETMVVFNMEFQANGDFKAELLINTSAAFRALATRVTEALVNYFIHRFPSFIGAEVRRIWPGSIWVEVELTFKRGTSAPDADSLRAALVEATSSSDFPLSVDVSSIVVTVGSMDLSEPTTGNISPTSEHSMSPPLNFSTGRSDTYEEDDPIDIDSQNIPPTTTCGPETPQVALEVAIVAACIMKEPVCLIESDSDGRLHMVPRAQKMLEQIEQHVVVVSVVGLYRTGKSYLMNKLAGANKGFPLGSTIQSKTKGIWMWCVPHPRKTDHTLVLLDTEGLGDIEKGDATNDNWIFAMAVLLSSTLVYNSMGTIDNKALENLHYVTELTKHIKMKSNKDENDDRTYVRFLPSFVWAVRDFSLDLELDGKPITADEYLENGLKDKPGKENQQYNEPRRCLRKFFLPRSCFVFERPARPKLMRRMEELTDTDLDPDFVQQTREFTEHIYTKSETKTIGDDIKVNGRLLGQLADAYLKAIRNGEVPCLENAVKALAEIENAKAVEQAQVLYVQRMPSSSVPTNTPEELSAIHASSENTKAVEQAQVLYVQRMQSVRFPTNTLEELSAVHASSEREALALFMRRSFRDDNREYQKKLVIVLQEEYNRFREKNFTESRKACEQIIKQVFKPLEDNLGAGLYAVPGGYKTFCQDLQMMTDKYRRAEGKGVKAEEVLKAYLDEKVIVGKALLAADKHVSEAQRKAEEDKAKWEEAVRERRAMEELQRLRERQMADRQRTQEENMRQLQEKMEREQMQAKAEHERLMAEIQEQKQRADEQEQQRLEDQQRQLEKEKNTGWWKSNYDAVTKMFSSFWTGTRQGFL